MVLPPMQSISGNNDGTYNYVVYGPPHGWYARFAMPAMFEALTVEVIKILIISSHNFGGPGDGTLGSISGTTPSFNIGII
jgi:hypothetical protein